MSLDTGFSILEQNAFNPSALVGDTSNLSKEVWRRDKLVGPMSVLFYQQPLELVRGEGVWLYDHQGKSYLDVYNNVQSLGHCHPYVAQRVAQQLTELNCHNRYLHEGLHNYAERLLATFPASLDRLMMTCTGSESNDLAIRLARHFTGRQGIIVTRLAYHGNTDLVSSVSPSAFRSCQLPDWLELIDIELAHNAEDPAACFLSQIEQAVSNLEQRGVSCAAFLADSIFSSDGVYCGPDGFIKSGIEYLQQHGALFIADEVQPGFGRTGTMWGFEHHRVVPDIVTLGKPMGNGYPVAGVVASADILQQFNTYQGYFNTFGGSTASVAAAAAVLDVIENENLVQNAAEVGHYLKTRLEQALGDYPNITQIRGRGLFFAIDICNSNAEPAPELVVNIVNQLKQQGVLMGTTGSGGSSLKLRPQLVFTKHHSDILVERLVSVMQSI